MTDPQNIQVTVKVEEPRIGGLKASTVQKIRDTSNLLIAADRSVWNERFYNRIGDLDPALAQTLRDDKKRPDIIDFLQRAAQAYGDPNAEAQLVNAKEYALFRETPDRYRGALAFILERILIERFDAEVEDGWAAVLATAFGTQRTLAAQAAAPRYEPAAEAITAENEPAVVAAVPADPAVPTQAQLDSIQGNTSTEPASEKTVSKTEASEREAATDKPAPDKTADKPSATETSDKSRATRPSDK